MTNNLSNATAIGYNAKVSASNSLVLGGTGATIVNVGIGVAAPSARLEVNSATSGIASIKFTQLNSGSSTTAANGKSLSLDVNGNIVLVPAAAADGTGTKVIAGANVSVTGTGSIANPYAISSSSPWVSSPLGTGTIINANTGGVIIGPGITSVPGIYKLYVSGGILTEKVKAALKTGATWADYVFDSNYKLRSLLDLEDFITRNKHLPGIPSAAELINDGGIDMNQMFAKQMEKIEELSLYLIDMSKEISLLKKQNEELLLSLSIKK